MWSTTFMVPGVRIFSRLHVTGLENLSGPGPFVFAANHTSHLDTPFTLAALPATLRKRTVVAAAMDTFFLSFPKAVITTAVFNSIPIDRHKINRRSGDQAIDLIQQGWNLLIYPEGGRTTTGDLMEFKAGAAFMAERSSATVVPIFIDNIGAVAGRTYAKAERFLSRPATRRPPVSISFGAPLRHLEGENLRRFNDRIRRGVAELAPGSCTN